MNRSRVLAVVLSAASVATALWACVGDDPSATSGPGAGDASTDTGTTSSNPDAQASDGGATDAGGDAGPRCDPKKPFAEVVLLKGISTPDDEHGVWVSGDELTAYVAMTPANGSTYELRRSTRTSRDADFSAPAAVSELAAINGSGTLLRVPSLTADQLVLVYSRKDGVFVSVRGSKIEPFPAGQIAKARANDVTSGEGFIAPGGESLLLSRDDGVNGYEIADAPRDVGGIYGDGGYLWYAPAPDVTNVNSVQDDRRAVYSPDRLTLVFASTRPPGGASNSDMYIAQRAGTGGTFTSPLRLPDPINSPSFDWPGSISDDGCILYFTSDRPGGYGLHDVYAAKRGK